MRRNFCEASDPIGNEVVALLFEATVSVSVALSGPVKPAVEAVSEASSALM